jgi:hypothetical protein
MTEAQIQRAVFQHIKQRGAPDAYVFAVPNGGFRRPIEAAIMKGLGVTPGVPDIIAIHNGKMFALEIKTETGRPTDSQLAAIEAIRRAGGFAAVCHGLDRTLACLETWGILRGRAA